MTTTNDTNEFTLDEVLKLVGSTVIVRPESEEMFKLNEGNDIPCWKGHHPVRGFRFIEGIFEVEIPCKPFWLGDIDYHPKSKFIEMFFSNNGVNL